MGNNEEGIPSVSYRPSDPSAYSPNIALIGAGTISDQHLSAYANAGYDVVTICNRTRSKAERRREEFYPDADICTDYRDVLDRSDVDVVDVLTHPEERVEIMVEAITAKKHVLSQKPFVLDLDDGERLIELAERHDVKLAVNQNARWAPHFSFARNAVQKGLLGQVQSMHFSVNWDHNWISDKRLNDVKHAILYDFAIHWFDVAVCLKRNKSPDRVFATFESAPDQHADPPLLASATVEYDDAQAVFAFDGNTTITSSDRTYVAGTRGSIVSEGAYLNGQSLTLSTANGTVSPDLEGQWFPDGFHGAMGELLCAIEADREPSNSARRCLESLELCFAAVASAETGEPKTPGTVTQLPA